LRKTLIIVGILLFITPIVNAQSISLGVGAFGGINIPVVQDDQSNGTVFGLLLRVKALPFLVIEPNVTFGKWGSPDPVDGVDLGIDGSKITYYCVDATLGGLPGVPGVKPYFLGGIGIYKIKNDDTGYDESKMGFSLGAGLGIGVLPKIDIDFRGKFIIAPQEESSKKAIYLTGGVTYNFGLGY
jgi:opacity protein-like surface antigen